MSNYNVDYMSVLSGISQEDIQRSMSVEVTQLYATPIIIRDPEAVGTVYSEQQAKGTDLPTEAGLAVKPAPQPKEKPTPKPKRPKKERIPKKPKDKKTKEPKPVKTFELPKIIFRPITLHKEALITVAKVAVLAVAVLGGIIAPVMMFCSADAKNVDAKSDKVHYVAESEVYSSASIEARQDLINFILPDIKSQELKEELLSAEIKKFAVANGMVDSSMLLRFPIENTGNEYADYENTGDNFIKRLYERIVNS